MSNLADVIIWLSIAFALLGVLLLIICIFARIPWPVKAAAIVLTSAFYVVSFFATRGLLGWSSTDPLPPKFKLLGARIVEPHSLEGDPGAIHLWVEALDDDNFPSGVPRAYRLHHDAHLADKTEAAIRASADGKPQGGRTADFGPVAKAGSGRGDGSRSHAVDDHHHGRRRSLLYQRLCSLSHSLLAREICACHLSLAAVRDGRDRGAAAKVGGMDRQTLRDWVHRARAGAEPGRERLAVSSPELALKHRLRKLRRHHRRRMPRMAKADRRARQNHIHRDARLGPHRSAIMTFGITAVRSTLSLPIAKTRRSILPRSLRHACLRRTRNSSPFASERHTQQTRSDLLVAREGASPPRDARRRMFVRPLSDIGRRLHHALH